MLVLGVEGELEVIGVSDWREEERTIACVFVGCFRIFGRITIRVVIMGERVRNILSVLPVFLYSSSGIFTASSEKIMVPLSRFPVRILGIGFSQTYCDYDLVKQLLKRLKRPSHVS